MTQFQIEGGGVVQSVTKLISTFFLKLLWPTTKVMPIKFTKKGVDSSILGSDNFVTKRWEKNPACYKKDFFFFYKKKLNFWDISFLTFQKVFKTKKNIKIVKDLYWL